MCWWIAIILALLCLLFIILLGALVPQARQNAIGSTVRNCSSNLVDSGGSGGSTGPAPSFLFPPQLAAAGNTSLDVQVAVNPAALVYYVLLPGSAASRHLLQLPSVDSVVATAGGTLGTTLVRGGARRGSGLEHGRKGQQQQAAAADVSQYMTNVQQMMNTYLVSGYLAAANEHMPCRCCFCSWWLVQSAAMQGARPTSSVLCAAADECCGVWCGACAAARHQHHHQHHQPGQPHYGVYGGSCGRRAAVLAVSAPAAQHHLPAACGGSHSSRQEPIAVGGGECHISWSATNQVPTARGDAICRSCCDTFVCCHGWHSAVVGGVPSNRSMTMSTLPPSCPPWRSPPPPPLQTTS